MKGVRFEGYCGYCGKMWHRQRDCWSRQGKMVNSVEADAADPLETNHTAEQKDVLRLCARVPFVSRRSVEKHVNQTRNWI